MRGPKNIRPTQRTSPAAAANAAVATETCGSSRLSRSYGGMHVATVVSVCDRRHRGERHHTDARRRATNEALRPQWLHDPACADHAARVPHESPRARLQKRRRRVQYLFPARQTLTQPPPQPQPSNSRPSPTGAQTKKAALYWAARRGSDWCFSRACTGQRPLLKLFRGVPYQACHAYRNQCLAGLLFASTYSNFFDSR